MGQGLKNHLPELVPWLQRGTHWFGVGRAAKGGAVEGGAGGRGGAAAVGGVGVALCAVHR